MVILKMEEEDKYQAILDVAESEGWEILLYTPDNGDDIHGITIGTTEYLDEIMKYFEGEDEGWIRPIR